MTFDIDPNTAGNQPLTSQTPGQYVLTISDNVQDIFGNALDGNLDGTPGGNYVFNFSIPTAQQTGPQLPITVTPPGPPARALPTMARHPRQYQSNRPAISTRRGKRRDRRIRGGLDYDRNRRLDRYHGAKVRQIRPHGGNANRCQLFHRRQSGPTGRGHGSAWQLRGCMGGKRRLMTMRAYTHRYSTLLARPPGAN